MATTRRMALSFIGVLAAGLAACAGPGRRGPGGPGGPGGMSSGGSPADFSHGVGLKMRGDFDAAIPYFAQAAGMGSGYEVAQYHLGDSLLLKSALLHGEEAANMQREGIFWIGFAARSSDVNGLAKMAELHFTGTGVAQDRVEAGMYMLMASSHARSDFIANDLRRTLEDMRLVLSEAELAEARARAAAFMPIVQSQRDFPRRERSQSGGRPSGSRPPGGGGGRGGPPGGGYLD